MSLNATYGLSTTDFLHIVPSVSNFAGIKAFGGYVPWMRLERAAIANAHSWYSPSLKELGKGRRAIGNWDEDVITFAVEAARSCLGAHTERRLGTLLLASTTAPFADRQNAGLVKEALNLVDDTGTLDVAGSRRAGTSGLLMALSAARGDNLEHLCIAAEKPRTQPASEGELLASDGAAALLVGPEPVVATFLGGYTVSVDFVDHFRGSRAEFDYVWESRWVREEGYGKIGVAAVKAALDKHGISGKDVRHFLMETPSSGVAPRVAKAAGIADSAVHRGLAREIGFAGAAAPIIQLVHALESAGPDEIVVLVGFGQGCDVLLFKTTAAILARKPGQRLQDWLGRGQTTDNYMRYLVINGHLNVERGMRAEMDMKTALSALYRDRKAVYALVGSRNPDTGVVQYPRSEIPLGSMTGRRTSAEDYRFADRTAQIASFTADRLGFYIDPPGYYGMLDFEGGGRLTADFTDMQPSDAVVGRTMRMAFRIKTIDESRGFARYFWKGVPQR